MYIYMQIYRSTYTWIYIKVCECVCVLNVAYCCILPYTHLLCQAGEASHISRNCTLTIHLGSPRAYKRILTKAVNASPVKICFMTRTVSVSRLSNEPCLETYMKFACANGPCSTIQPEKLILKSLVVNPMSQSSGNLVSRNKPVQT